MKICLFPKRAMPVYETAFSVFLALSIIVSFTLSTAAAGPKTQIDPAEVLGIMERAADWQLAHPAKHSPTGWAAAAGDAGIMALAGISPRPKYLEAMKEMGSSSRWRLGPRIYMADDYCIGQLYAELYLRYRENYMIDSLRMRFNYILDHPPAVKSLELNPLDAKTQDVWSWCDALFMGPPAWIRLYAATGDKRCLNFAVENWWRTTKSLYDRKTRLFFRDGTYIARHEPNGKRMFWGRGNGWVMAGLVRMLQYLPANYPGRGRFVKLFREMAGEIAAIQQPDSLWHASLLDPADYPGKETSGSGLLTYALACGVNQNILSRSGFEPVVLKAWTALTRCVDKDGMLTHVQPVGGDPQKFDPNSTDVYGTGAFLLAGSEVYRMAVLACTRHVKITVTNPANFRRSCETVELDLRKVAASLGIDPSSDNVAVMDGLSSRIMDSQVCAEAPGGKMDMLLFQVDLAPHESRIYYVLDASALPGVPKPIVKTFARYVPERYDDFAWESDRIAHRVYGQALMTAPGEPLTSSGIDVWVKRTRDLAVNRLYESGQFHNDSGSAMDDYRVGTGRGDGGLGVWDGKRLFVSKNYHNWKLITTGPIRSVFELTYDTWDAGGGRTVSEVKRISIDAGSWMSKDVSTFESNLNGPLTVGVGLAERSCGPNGREIVEHDRVEGWMTYWQPEDRPKGITGVAILLPKGSVQEFTNDKPELPDSVIHAAVPQPIVEGAPPIRDLLAITGVKVGKPFTYYFGACWNESGDFVNSSEWENYVRRFAERRDFPLRVTIGR